MLPFLYSGDLSDEANDLIPKVNAQIGNSLCVDNPGVTVVTSTATLTADGSQVNGTHFSVIVKTLYSD